MIRPNPIWLAAIALMVTSAPAPAEVSRVASQRSISATGLKGLRVFNRSGRVRLQPSADGQIHLTAVKVLHGAGRDRDRLSSGTRVDATEEQGVYVVRVTYPQGATVRVNLWDLFSSFEMPRVEVELTLDVPGSLPVQVTTSSGDVESNDIAGPQQLFTSSGDILLGRAGGPVETKSSSGDVRADGLSSAAMRTTSGDLVISDVRGPLVVRTSSGDVTVRAATDSISIATGSGDVRVDRAPRGLTLTTSSGEACVTGAAGRVTIETGSGDVRAELLAPLGPSRITSSSGDVGVKLDARIGCALELRTSNGTLDVSAPVRVGEVNRHALTAQFGRGTTPLTVRTTSGDIHVTSGGN